MEARIELLMKDGQFTVHAPFADRALCYGMLELARDVIKDRAEALQRSAVVEASAADVSALTNGARRA